MDDLVRVERYEGLRTRLVDAVTRHMHPNRARFTNMQELEDLTARIEWIARLEAEEVVQAADGVPFYEGKVEGFAGAAQPLSVPVERKRRKRGFQLGLDKPE
jgi:hypothetical protein